MSPSTATTGGGVTLAAAVSSGDVPASSAARAADKGYMRAGEAVICDEGMLCGASGGVLRAVAVSCSCSMGEFEE